MSRRGSPAAKAQRLRELPELLRLRTRTTKELAEKFHVARRDVQRDIQTLRSEGFDIRSPSRGSYELPAAGSRLNPMEAMAVHAATRLLHHHAPAYNRHYLSAMEKLAAMLPEPARSVALRNGVDIPERPAEDRALELAARAWFEGRVLSAEYRSSGSSNWHRNEFEVYLIEVNRDNLAPYAIAHERSFFRGVRTWKLSRMRNVRLLDDTYEIPAEFDPGAFLSGAWGVIGANGGPMACVRLRFAPEAVARVEEGGYPGLEPIGTEPGGNLLVEIRTGTDADGFPREILPWVQSWGARVEVLAPEALRERWLQEARLVSGMAPITASPDDGRLR